MDYDEILKKIIRRYGVKTENVRLTQVIESKLKKHTATYADAQNYAQAIGKALTEVFREYLPEALTDGKLYRAAAEVLMQQPMVRASRDIDKVAGAIQAEINENAGLGINPIVPEVNQDQIDGIITGICNAESFDAGKEVLFDQVENFMEGHVDDFVRENADFQYQAGLDPKVIRTAAGKCCKWCSNLAGTYKYEDVKDRGNDVWRRHRNCHCVIEYDPGQKSGKKNPQSGRPEPDDELRERRLRFGQEESFDRDMGSVKARPVENYRANNLFIDQNVNLSPREIRRINKQITQAKELHGVTGTCDSPFVIVKDADKLASYNPRTNTFFISSKLADEKGIAKLQESFTCKEDPRSTMVHEIFHWKDAEAYRTNVGAIQSAAATSDYSIYQRERATAELLNAGFSMTSEREFEGVSRYAADMFLDNNFEEVYTEFRTQQLIEGGALR